ncbi:MAG: hypothetical protein P8Z68_00450 [Kineosporiaceae bacterium]
MDRGSLRADLSAAEALPFGTARTAAVERIVERADAAGDASVAWSARTALVSAYTFGGEPMKRFVPFAWLLERYDDPTSEISRPDRHSLLWQFKWMTGGAVTHPGIPLAQIEQGLADMEQRYREAGEGLAPYLGSRYEITSHVHGDHAAEADYLAWTRAPRTSLSDCNACEPSTRGGHLAAVGRHADALREFDPVLRNGGCQEQPQSAIGEALESLLVLGQTDRAAAEHLRGVRLMRGQPSQAVGWDEHLLVLARSGRLMRGLDLLEEIFTMVEAPPSPSDGMWLAAAGARLLRGLDEAGFGDLPVTVRTGAGAVGRDRSGADRPTEEPVATLAERLSGTARDWARQFDARNGTSAIGEAVAEWLDAGPLPDLPLDQVASSRDGLLRRGRTPARAGGARERLAGNGAAGGDAPGRGVPGREQGTGPGPAPADPQRWAEEFAEIGTAYEGSRVSGWAAPRRQALNRWRVLRGAPSRVPDTELDAALAAQLDAGLAVEDVLDGSGPIEDVHAAAEALGRVGDTFGAAWYALVGLRWELERAADTPPPAADLLTRLDAVLDRAARDCTPVDMVALQNPVAGVILSGAGRGVFDEPVVVERLTAMIRQVGEVLDRVDVDQLTAPRRASLAQLLRLDARFAGHELPAVAELLSRAWGLLPAGIRAAERASIGGDLAAVLADLGHPDQALDLLPEVIADAEHAEEPLDEARALALAGRLRSAADEAVGAANDLAAAARLLAEHGEPEELTTVRRDQVHALRAAGRSVEAAEVAENALQAWERHLTAQGLTPDQDPGADPAADGPDEDLARGARLAGMVAYAAAVSCADLTETARAADHARRSADWHRSAGWGAAEAESRGLSGDLDEDPARSLDAYRRSARLYEEAGEWLQAARRRRSAAGAALAAEGLPAALDVIAGAKAALDGREPADGDDAAVLAWEQLALVEQHAAVLARGGQPAEALTVLDGVADGYREAGDLRSVVDVAVLRADCLQELDREEEALPELSAVAEEVLAAGEPDHARRAANQLSWLLEELGREEEAERVWERFSPET